MREIYDYLNKDKAPICREERQYALFLYNIFLNKKKADKYQIHAEKTEYSDLIIEKFLGKKSENIVIEDVFYEATLMRDYHFCSDDKKSFVHDLIEFCFVETDTKNLIDCITEEINKDDRNPGAIDSSLDGFMKTKNSVLSNISFSFAKMMMNATPDIMVIYRKKGGAELMVKGIECKYLSSEGRYKDVLGSYQRMQFFVQECVMAFLFGNWSEIAEGYVPQQPTKGNWKDNKSLWDTTYGAFYSKMLKQETIGIVGNNNSKIINRGITIAKFIDQNESDALKPNYGEVQIEIKKLLTEGYFFNDDISAN